MKRSSLKKYRPAGLAGVCAVLAGLAILPARAETSLVIRDFVISRDVHQREPKGATDFFRANDGKAIAFARIWNGGQPVRISFLWRRGEKVHATVPATVGTSPAWRTWSTVKLAPGAWRVALVDPEGAVLAERTFRVGPDPDVPVATTPSSTLSVQDPSDVTIDAIAPAPIPVSADYPAQ